MVRIPNAGTGRRSGKHNQEVKLLQAALACRGYSVTVDGLWSKSLTEKVKAFQSSHNLTPVDGVVGPMTWACILYLS